MPAHRPNTVELWNAYRSGSQYRADLYAHGVRVGTVEKDLTQGGMGADQYVATVEGVKVVMARTMADLRSDLAEWVAEEEQMEMDAVWMRLKRQASA